MVAPGPGCNPYSLEHETYSIVSLCILTRSREVHIYNNDHYWNVYRKELVYIKDKKGISRGFHIHFPKERKVDYTYTHFFISFTKLFFLLHYFFVFSIWCDAAQTWIKKIYFHFYFIFKRKEGFVSVSFLY